MAAALPGVPFIPNPPAIQDEFTAVPAAPALPHRPPPHHPMQDRPFASYGSRYASGASPSQSRKTSKDFSNSTVKGLDQAGEGVRSIFHAVHDTGESTRGGINSFLDRVGERLIHPTRDPSPQRTRSNEEEFSPEDHTSAHQEREADEKLGPFTISQASSPTSVASKSHVTTSESQQIRPHSASHGQETVKAVEGGIKSVFQIIHGGGETARGGINSFLDRVGDTIVHPTKGAESERPHPNEGVLRDGMDEMDQGMKGIFKK